MRNKPCNAGAERAVLAGLCQFGRTAYYDVSDILTINSFIIEGNQALYKCIDKVLQQSETVDATSIIAASDSLGLSTILTKNKTDIEYIRALFNFPIKLPNVRVMAKQVAKLEFIRQSQSALNDAQDKLDLFDGTESIDEIVSIPEQAIFSLTNAINSRSDSNPVKLGEGLEERLKFLAANQVEMKGIPTPWSIYNDIIGGGLRTGVHLIAARPKIGKSSLALNCGWHVSDTLQIPVLYIDTEMVQEEQENRLIALVSGVENRIIETGKFGQNTIMRQKVYDAVAKIKNSKFHHKWVGGKNFEEIVSIMRRWILSEVGFDENGNTKPHLIIYDYFKLMNDSSLDKMQEYQAIGFQISYLSDFCKQYDSPCLSFVQVNRDGITKDSSDIISQSDRLLWLCTSAAVFKRKDKEEIMEDDGPRNGNRKLFLLESRFGEPLDEGDYICMNLDGAISKITELKTKFQLSALAQSTQQGFDIEETKEESNQKISLNDLQ
jgi:replicative DNA helicase